MLNRVRHGGESPSLVRLQKNLAAIKSATQRLSHLLVQAASFFELLRARIALRNLTGRSALVLLGTIRCGGDVWFTNLRRLGVFASATAGLTEITFELVSPV